MSIHTAFLTFVIAAFASSCIHRPAGSGTSAGSEKTLRELHTLMTGSFDSRAQAMVDSTYYPISLHMYPIWTSRPGRWLYVEQAIYTGQDKPYRQRVYGLEAGPDDTYLSRVYELPAPEDFVGKYATPKAFDQLTLADLEERPGCAVILRRQADGSYAGSTKDKECLSTLRGAAYATSRVTIFPGRIESWDQGFNAAGEQVWGATEGGYVFEGTKEQ
ncbi:MAG: chromophore lyase CpcT/CpeT [Saprospiraceae bacterium]